MKRIILTTAVSKCAWDHNQYRGVYPSDSLTAIKELAATFPNKPLMISECGFSYHNNFTGENTSGYSSGFKDVKSYVWYVSDAGWAASKGIVTDYSRDHIQLSKEKPRNHRNRAEVKL